MSRAPQSTYSVPQQTCHTNTTQQQYRRQELSLPTVMPNSSTNLGPLLTHHQQVLPSVKPPAAHQHHTSNPRHPSVAYQQLAVCLRQSSPAHQFHQQHLQQPLLSRDSPLTNQHQSSSFQVPPSHQQQTFHQNDPTPACQQPSTSGSSLFAYSNLPLTSITHLMNPYMDVGASSHVVSSSLNKSTQDALRNYCLNRTDPQVHQGSDGSSSMRTTLHSGFPNYFTIYNPGVGSSQSGSMTNGQSYTLPVQPIFFQTPASSEQLHTLGLNNQTVSQRPTYSQPSIFPDGTIIRTVGSQCNVGGELGKKATNTYHNNTSQSNSSTSHQQSLSQNNTRTQNVGMSHMMPVEETDQLRNRFLRCLLRLDTQTAIPDAFTDSSRPGGICNMNTQESNKATHRTSISTTKQPLMNHPLQIPNEVPFIVPPNWNPAAAAALHSQQDDSEQDGSSSGLLGRWYQIPGMEKENTNTCPPTQTYTKDNESFKSSATTPFTEIISHCVSNLCSAQVPICTSTSTTNVTSTASFLSISPLSSQVMSKLSTSVSSIPSPTETVTTKLKPSTTSDFTITPSILTNANLMQNTKLVASSGATVLPGSADVLMSLNNVQVQEVNSVSSSSESASLSKQGPELIKNKESFVPCPGLNSWKESNSSSVSPSYNSVNHLGKVNNSVNHLGKVNNVNSSNETRDLGVIINPKDLSKEELAQKFVEISNLINQSKLKVAKKHSRRRETSNKMQSEYATEDTTTANSLLIDQIAESESPCSKHKRNESDTSPSVMAENVEGNIDSDRHVINADCASITSADVNIEHVTESFLPAASQIDNENDVDSSGLGICILNTFSLAHIGHKSPKETYEAKNTLEVMEIKRKRKIGDKFVNSIVKKSKQSCDKAEDDGKSRNECISRRAKLELPLEKGSKTNTDIRKFHSGYVQEVLEISEDEDDLEDVAKEHKQPQSAEKQCERGSPKEKTAGDNVANVEGEVNELTTLSHEAFIDTIASEMKSCFNIVTFHNKKLLQVEIESEKFFIMKELLNKCFESFKQRNYFRVFKAKEYHLKIPVIDLPKKFKPYTIQYLELNTILKPGQSNPDKYISIIEQNNAEKLYLFDFNKITMNSLSKNVKEVGVDSYSQNAKQERPIEDVSNNSLSHAAPQGVPAPGAIVCEGPVVITLSDSDTASCTESQDSDSTLPYIDGKARHLVLNKRKSPKKTRPSKKKKQNEKMQDKTDVQISGTMEVNGVSMRYINNNMKRYIPFEDLARSFPQINIYSILKEGNCPMINCPSDKVSIFNNTDVSLPKLGKNPILVEYDSFQSLVLGLQESASPVAAESQKRKHTEKSTAKKLLALYSKTLQKLKESCLAPHEAESSGKDQERCELSSTKQKSPAATEPTLMGDMQNSPSMIKQKTSSTMVRTIGRLQSLKESDSSVTNEKSIVDNKSVQMNNMSKHSYESLIGNLDKSSPTLKDNRMARHSSQKKTSNAGRELEQIRQAMLNRPYVALERLSPIIVRRLMGKNTDTFKPQKENSTKVTKCVSYHNSGQQERKTVPLKEISLPIQDHHQRDNFQKPDANRYLGSDNDTVCSIHVCESVHYVNQKSQNAEVSGQCHIINCKDSKNVSTPGGDLFPKDGLVKSIHIHEDVHSKDLDSNDCRKIVVSEVQNEPMTVDRDTGRDFPGTDITEMEHEDIDSNTKTLLNEDLLESSSNQPALCPTIEQRDTNYNSVLEEIQNLIDEGKKTDETTDVNVFPSDYSDHEDFQASLSNALGSTSSRLQFFGRPSESREGDQFFRFGEQFDNILLTASCQALRTVLDQIQRN
ncbi:hypothetical protein ACJMK2_044136 [Sinanodonta woodiana]|uniref:Uncharacterized protein n=1 Tax=Sinanodonta woodiana TaxID=1069815 RepID=A0ABD3W0W9_SINWO